MSSNASSNTHLRLKHWGVETTLKLLQADQRNRPTGFTTDNELLLLYSPLEVETRDETMFEISITPPSAVPQWIQVSPISIQRGSPAQTITLQYTDSDANGASNEITKQSGPSWAVLNSTARTITITPPAAGTTSQPAQTFNVVVRVQDPSPNEENKADMTIQINLAAYTYTPPPPPIPPPPDPDPVDPPPTTNQPPTLAEVANLIMDAGGSVGRVIHVADPDTPLADLTLTKTGVGTLTRLNNPRFYEFRYSESTPTANRAQQVHTVNLSLTDGENTITESFTVTVRAFTYVPPPPPTAVPQWTQVQPINIERGGAAQTITLSYTDSDANQASNIVSKRSGPTWAVLNSTARTLTITPPAAGTTSQSAQTFQVVVRVTDPSPNQANLDDMTITINLAAYTYTPPVNEPPIISNAVNLTISAGGTARGVIQVADPDNTLDELTLTKSGVGTLTRRTDKRYYDFSYNDTLPDDDRARQSHTVNLSLTDGDNTVTDSFTVRVNAYTAPVNEPPVIVTHPHITIDSGGTATSVIQVTDPDTAIGSVTLTKTGVGTLTRRTDKRYYDFVYADALPTADRAQQTHTVTLSLTDGENIVTSSFRVTVRAYIKPPPPATNTPPRLDAIADITLNRGQSVDIPITFIDPDSDTSDITITLRHFVVPAAITSQLIITGTGNARKWFWRVSTPASSIATPQQHVTANFNIADGEDAGNGIASTATIRAYTPPRPLLGPPTITIITPRANQNVATQITDPYTIGGFTPNVLIVSYDGVRLQLTADMINVTMTNPNLPLQKLRSVLLGNQFNKSILLTPTLRWFTVLSVRNNRLADYNPANPVLITLTITAADPISGQTASATVNFKIER